MLHFAVKFRALAKSLVLLERHRRRTFSSRQRSVQGAEGGGEDLVDLLLKAQEQHIREVAEEEAGPLREEDEDISDIDPSILRRPLLPRWKRVTSSSHEDVDDQIRLSQLSKATDKDTSY